MHELDARKQATSSEELMPELKNRWSPRAFSEKALEEWQLRALFEAARWAASSSNQQPWRFLVARREDAHYPALREGLMEGNDVWAHRAPVLVATLARKKRVGKDAPNPHAWHDLGLAMGNLCAQATHLGLFVHQMAGIHPEKVAANFGVDTEEFDVVSMAAIGHRDPEGIDQLHEGHAKAEIAPRERSPLEELVFACKVGEPAEWTQKK
jgi:nitroreductase